MNEEEELQEPDPSQGVAEPDYTLDIGLYSVVGPLKGVARSINFIKNAIDLTKPASQRTVDVDVVPIQRSVLRNNLYEMTKPAKGAGELLKRTLLDSDLGQLYKIIKRGELIMDFTAGGNNPKDKSQPLDDDALSRRYKEINNPDSYVTDPEDPNYGKLKSEITFEPQGQLDLDIQTPDPITVRSMMKRALDNNLTTNNRLDFPKLLQSKTFQSSYRRFIASDIATPPSKGLAQSKLTRRTLYQSRQVAFNNYRKELLDEFKSIYGNDISALGFPESQLDLDHKLTLVQSLGMLHNTNPADPLWRRITRYALERGYTPGDAEANLDLLDPESHRVKTNFFNDLHGLTKGNLRYWGGLHRNTGKTRLQIMNESHLSDAAADLHMEVVKDYFDVVDRGDAILQDARRIFKAENKLGILPEEIVDELMPVILDKKYSPVQVQAAIRDIVTRNSENYKNLLEQVELLELIENYEDFNKPGGSSTLTRQEYQDTDPQIIKEAKVELRKLRRVNDRKSYVERVLDQRAKAKEKEEASGNIQGDLLE